MPLDFCESSKHITISLFLFLFKTILKSSICIPTLSIDVPLLRILLFFFIQSIFLWKLIFTKFIGLFHYISREPDYYKKYCFFRIIRIRSFCDRRLLLQDLLSINLICLFILERTCVICFPLSLHSYKSLSIKNDYFFNYNNKLFI